MKEKQLIYKCLDAILFACNNLECPDGHVEEVALCLYELYNFFIKQI